MTSQYATSRKWVLHVNGSPTRSKGEKPNSYSVSVVSESKVLKYLNALSVDKAMVLDGIRTRFVRDSASLIVCPLTHIINLCNS